MAITSIGLTPTKLGRRLLNSQLIETIIAPNGVDRYAELIDPIFSVRDVRARVESVHRTTPRSVTLVLRPNDNFRGFAAGQHVGLIVEVDGVLTTRFYSPANSALSRDGLIELTVSVHPDGTVSEHLFDCAHEGMVVGMTPAEGEFTLPAKHPDQVLLIGGGSGITPVMSMLRTLIDEGYGHPITFIHYARTPEDALYSEQLKEIGEHQPNVTVHNIFTRAKRTEGVESGHISRAQLRRVCPDFETAETFVCGPNALIDAAEKIWTKDGNAGRLHTESFVLPEPVVVAEDATGEVTFSQSGVTIDNDGTTLLAQAEASGLTPRCGCRMGICHTCIAHVDEGAVRDVRTGEVRTVQNEHIQICVNAPVGDIQIEL